MKLRSGKRYGMGRHRGVIKPLLYTGLRTVGKYFGSRVKTRLSGTSGGGVTNQFDRSRQYRYRPLSRRKRFRARRRFRRFEKLLNKRLAKQTVLFNTSNTVNVTGVSVQSFVAAQLYGWRGTDTTQDVGNSDMSDLYNNDARIGSASKYEITDAVLDFTGRNTGTTSTLEIDVYEYFTRADNALYSSLQDLLGKVDSDTPVINGAGFGIGIGTRGAGPFELPVLCENIKIIKKTKFLLSPGQAFTYIVKDRRPRIIWGDDVSRVTVGSNFHRNGFTRGLLCVVKNAIGEGALTVGTFVGGASRIYRYVITQESITKDQAL